LLGECLFLKDLAHGFRTSADAVTTPGVWEQITLAKGKRGSESSIW
jgi:hypothetical protein